MLAGRGGGGVVSAQCTYCSGLSGKIKREPVAPQHASKYFWLEAQKDLHVHEVSATSPQSSLLL